MAIDFPNSPATNATYTVGNKTWIYDGATWNTYNSTSFSAETLPGTTIKSTVTGSSLTSVGTLTSLGITGNLTVDTNVLVVDTTNNYVGINNASPSQALDVNGVINTRLTSGYDSIALLGPSSTSGYTLLLTSSSLTAPRTITLPNATGTVITTGNLTDFTVTAGTTSTGATGVGYMGLPQNATTTGSYTLVAADAGKHIYSTATRTVTIPSNASVAMPVGTTITFANATGATVTIAITSDTLILVSSGTTGSRTLAPFGMATAVKVAATQWMISGNGLT